MVYQIDNTLMMKYTDVIFWDMIYTTFIHQCNILIPDKYNFHLVVCEVPTLYVKHNQVMNATATIVQLFKLDLDDKICLCSNLLVYHPSPIWPMIPLTFRSNRRKLSLWYLFHLVWWPCFLISKQHFCWFLLKVFKGLDRDVPPEPQNPYPFIFAQKGTRKF